MVALEVIALVNAEKLDRAGGRLVLHENVGDTAVAVGSVSIIAISTRPSRSKSAPEADLKVDARATQGSDFL